jgi:uncharacterized damage-inducible protein DinB
MLDVTLCNDTSDVSKETGLQKSAVPRHTAEPQEPSASVTEGDNGAKVVRLALNAGAVEGAAPGGPGRFPHQAADLNELTNTDKIDDMTRTDKPPSWDERATLTTMLDYVRATVHAKCEGLTEKEARKALLPDSPLMTIAGLVSHVRWVDHWWIEVVFFGEEDRHPGTEEEPDREFVLDTPLPRLLEEYEAQSVLLRERLWDIDLDTRSKGKIKNGEHVTLRWVLMHLVEETARHNGHIDIIRELIDGAKGM